MGTIPEWLHLEVNDYFAAPIKFEPKTVLDIGANIGAFAVRAHKEWPQAQVICYEPIAVNVKSLRENVNHAWCQVNESAIRAHSGEDEIFIGDMFVTSGFKKGARQTPLKITVPCIAASSLPSCELVKIDTEGCEVEILVNLDLRNTKVIMLEHHSLSDAQKILRMLTPEFKLAHDETNRDVGTEIYIRNTSDGG